MPGKVKVRVVAGRSLPVMDRSNDTTDAYVEVKLGQVTYKTDVCRKSLNPQWNSEWFKFEMDDLELQDEPLQIRLMDYDTYSANDAIGKVYLDLNPLLINSAKAKENWGKTISGWLPVYDTMHGLRGEVNLIVKVELFSDLNKYRQSSCGVRFFFSPHVPEGFIAHSINGFVEELVINDDPEYQWIDKIRGSRASNEARQTLFQKLSGEVQRKIGLKTLELGGNAVVGYKQCIDLEGESGALVIRGIGTAMYITKLSENQLSPVPMGSDGTSKEYHSLSLCQQHSLPRKRKQIPSPSLQRRCRHLLPSMNNPSPDPFPLPIVNKAAIPSRSNLGRGGLSSSFSNLFVRNKSNKSSSPIPSQDERYRGRSESPPKIITSGGLGRISPNTILYHDDNTHKNRNSIDDSKSSQTPLKMLQSSFAAPNPNSEPPKHFKDKDKKDIQSALLTITNMEDDDLKNFSTNSTLGFSMTPGLEQDRYLAEMESDLALDLELVASGGDTLSEISEERESQEFSQESFRTGTAVPVPTTVFRPTLPHHDRPRPRPLSLSEKESDDCSISEDSPPTSPTSTTSSKTNKFTLLNLGKKHRWMTRRERLSTNCLVKRASSNVSSASGPGGPLPVAKSSSSNSSSTTKIRKELGKIFKRISFSGDGDSDTNNSNPTKAKKLSPTRGPYRTPRRLFFRRRRTRNRSNKQDSRPVIVRSNSQCESHSFALRQTSSETSLHSVGSEPPVMFNFQDEDDNISVGECENNSSSLLEIQTDLATKGYSEKSKISENVINRIDVTQSTPQKRTPTAVSVDHSKLRELIGDLGYDTGKPLKLYISSMDALLVYDPAFSGSVNSSSCVCLNVDNSSSASVYGAAATADPAFHGLLDIDSNPDPNIRDRVDTLLKLRRAGSSELNLEGRARSYHPISSTFQKKNKRHRTETLVECNSSTSSNSSGSMATSSRSTSTTSSSGPTSATSSSCTKALQNLGIRRLKFRQSDDEQVEEDLEESVGKLENFVRDAQQKGCVIATGSGCRSPIPEEFVESASSSCVAPNVSVPSTSHAAASNSSSPPKRIGSPQKQISNANSGSSGSGFYGDHHESKNSGHMMYNGGSGSPEKGSRGGGGTGALVASTPNSKHGHSHYGQMYRRSSESDLSTTPKGGAGFNKAQFQRPLIINVEPIRGQEFPFITLSSQFPEGFILYLGGTVTARSVKLLKSIGNFEEPSPETRDGWWNELRIEMRSHMRSFQCNIILDYEEKTTMWDEVAILSASGTAAIIATGGDVSDGGDGNKDGHKRNDSFTGVVQLNTSNGSRYSPKTQRGDHNSDELEYPCSMLHIPQASLSLPTIVRKTRCAYCRKGKVPDVILASIDLPLGLHTTGRSCLIQTQVFRSKKESKGEVGAKEMSDSIPFLEYELHRRLINKLKVKGLNAIFGYKVQITQGDKVVVGVATGTAIFLTALPVPSIPTICAGNLKTDSQKVVQFQKVIQETFEKNREIFGVKNIVVPHSGDGENGSTSDDESDDELNNDAETKDTFVLEVDDAEDIDIITMLIDPAIPAGYNMSNIETLVGFDGRRVLHQQMFNQVWRCKIATITQRQLTTYFERLIRLLCFKLRRLQPIYLVRMLWTIDLPESDEMQLCVIGMALGLDSKTSLVALPNTITNPQGANELGKHEADDPDIMFQFDDDKSKLLISSSAENVSVIPDQTLPTATPPHSAGMSQNISSATHGAPPGLQSKLSAMSLGSNPAAISLNVGHGHGNSVLTNNINMPLPVSKMRHWVEITPLSVIPGAKIERYLGNLNFYFIRETSSLRESGGVNTFLNTLFTDFMAIVRAHVSALGGNAIVSYFMTRCDLIHNLKNQEQCVINVGGDAVFVTYPIGNHPEDGISIG